MCGFGSACCLGVVARPVPPSAYDGQLGSEELLRYSALLDKYYALCGEVVAANRFGGFPSCNCVVGGGRESAVLSLDGQQVQRLGICERNEVERAVLGDVERVEVGGDGRGSVEEMSGKCVDVRRPDGTSSVFNSLSCVERFASRGCVLGKCRCGGRLCESIESFNELADAGSAVGAQRPVDAIGTGGKVGFVGPVRGKNYEKNRAKKERRRLLRSAAVDSDFVEGVETSGVWRSERVERLRSQLRSANRERVRVVESGARNVSCDDGVQRKKKTRQEKRARGHFSDLPDSEQKSLKDSYAARLTAENELRVFRARQQLELEKAKDMSQLKKRQETQIMRQTELNKVQVEKAFAQLSRTGNVPGVIGTVKTVVSAEGLSDSPVFSGVGSGSISPNSSISLAEIHALQKSELAKTHEIEKLRARLDKVKSVTPELYADLGFNRELPPTVGTGVTVDESGNPVGYDLGDDSSECFGYEGYVAADGRFHFGQDPAIYDA